MEILLGFLFCGLLLAVVVLQILQFRVIQKNRVTIGATTEQGITQVALELNRLYMSVMVALEARGIHVPPVTPSGGEENLTEEERLRAAALRKAELFRKVRR